MGWGIVTEEDFHDSHLFFGYKISIIIEQHKGDCFSPSYDSSLESLQLFEKIKY